MLATTPLAVSSCLGHLDDDGNAKDDMPHATSSIRQRLADVGGFVPTSTKVVHHHHLAAHRIDANLILLILNLDELPDFPQRLHCILPFKE